MAEALTVIPLCDLGMDLHFTFNEAQVSALSFELTQDVRVDLTYPMHNVANAGTQFE